MDATQPRAAEREAAVHERSKMSDKERVIAAMIRRLSSPSLSTLGEGESGEDSGETGCKRQGGEGDGWKY